MTAWSRVRRYGAKRVLDIFDNLMKRNLWRRMLKNTIATTAAVSICLIPGAKVTLGKAAYLAAMTTVFGHPGRRFGQLVEALILVLLGALLGLAWSLLGLYLASLTIATDPPSAYAIRGVFLAVAVIIHGYFRSYAPRLWVGLLLLVLVSIITLLSTAKQVTRVTATQILYPILSGAAIILFVNLSVFPEFSSSFLGQVTIETLDDAATALKNAGLYFSHFKGAAARKDDSERFASTKNDEKTEKKSPRMLDSHLDASAANERQNVEVTDKQIGNSLSSHKSMIANSIARTIESMAGRKNNAPARHAGASKGSQNITLSALTSMKGSLRQKLINCKAAQDECNFEIAYSVLPPRELKEISAHSMTKLIANTVAIISTCESKFALVGDSSDPDFTESPEEEHKGDSIEQVTGDIDPMKADLELIKPRRKIEFGDVRLFCFLLRSIEKPYTEMSTVLFNTVALVNSCIAYAYGVRQLPSGAKVPKHMAIEELDDALGNLQTALQKFEADTTTALENAAIQQESQGFEADIMPREEIFLISSFLLNFSQATAHIQDMLKNSRKLVDGRQQRRGRRRLYAPRIKWATWLFSGGEQDEALPPEGRKAHAQAAASREASDQADADAQRSNNKSLNDEAKTDLEKASQEDEVLTQERDDRNWAPTEARQKSRRYSNESWTLRLRGMLADTVEWIQESDDLLYALKLATAVFLVTWPAFVARWNTWYSLNRGVWAALQLIFVTEVSIGTSVWTFFVRAIGTTLGCLWGWAAWEARHGEPIVCAVMICIGIIPSTYLQLGTKHPKAGQVCIISMCVVALSTQLGTVPGTATENFLKRWIAFMIGGFVALIVEMVLLPVKARTRLVESIAAALRYISEMENGIAAGIEEGVNLKSFAADRIACCEHASGKANRALSAAEVFLSFCSSEPRIKGSFEGPALIYSEILFVLHQIVDRMNNMVQLRTAYGSGPLEELNAQIYPYRRNVAGSITISLFAIHGALTTKIPLPQFLPSARLAHLRMINRVRELVLTNVSKSSNHHHEHEEASRLALKLALRRKYMAWNAASAAQAEIIEFLEELIDLTKLLVGANEFRTGLLTRPTHGQYTDAALERKSTEKLGGDAAMDQEARDEFKEMPPGQEAGLRNRKRATSRINSEDSDEVPASLRRIQSRKIEAGIRRQKTNDGWK